MGNSYSHICVDKFGEGHDVGTYDWIYVGGVGDVRRWSCCGEFTDSRHKYVLNHTSCKGKPIGKYNITHYVAYVGNVHEWSCCGSGYKYPAHHN